MKEIQYTPIGIIHSPFKHPFGTPIQPSAAKTITAEIEIFQQYSKGLTDLEGFSHIIVLYHFHLAKQYSLQVKPFLDDTVRGIFATRAVNRPNPIGLSIVKLLKVDKNILHIQHVDIIDKTPLLDIKPYVPVFDEATHTKTGWLEKNIDNLSQVTDDGRFSE
ncbi:MAG: tRNA (N6-threonylcarbamoyladenosine(37)-N6)-methyltransferase TrmO [Thermoplasmatota archaeon]